MDKAVRKALETTLDSQHAALIALMPSDLQAAMTNGKVPIEWPNKAWDGKAPLYIRPTFAAGDPIYRELGRSARKDVPGMFKVDIFTPAQSGLDLADNLANVIALAYPYGSELVTTAGTVEITKVAKRQGMPIDSRWFTPVHINFTLWRAS